LGASTFLPFFGATNYSYSSSDYTIFLAAFPLTGAFFTGFSSYDYSSEVGTLATGFLVGRAF